MKVKVKIMSIINWELQQKLKPKKRLTYSKEPIKLEDYTLKGKIKRFFKKLFKKLPF
jgi:hypothetical protein